MSSEGVVAKSSSKVENSERKIDLDDEGAVYSEQNEWQRFGLWGGGKADAEWFKWSEILNRNLSNFKGEAVDKGKTTASATWRTGRIENGEFGWGETVENGRDSVKREPSFRKR